MELTRLQKTVLKSALRDLIRVEPEWGFKEEYQEILDILEVENEQVGIN